MKENPATSSAKPVLEKGISSKFAVAVVAFMAVNLLASGFKLALASPMQFPYSSWTSHAINDFAARRETPNLVFLGSSLMLCPLDGVDADFTKKRIDGAAHHQSMYFESQWRKLTGSAASTFNFALPGEMPSDAYLITDFLLSKKRPDVLVYGVGPRDFMDSLLQSPSSTDPYQMLSRFGDVAPLVDRTTPGFVARLNFELGRAVYLYGQKTDISENLNRVAGNKLTAVFPEEQYAISNIDRRRLLPSYHPLELFKGEAYFVPTADGQHKFSDANLAEYRTRYKKLNWTTFCNQMQFLTQTLCTARKSGIKTVLVAMPITDVNRSLISDDAWSAYRRSLKLVAATQGALFLDFSETDRFSRDDFMDTVHLHATGGRRFLSILAEELSKDKQISSALSKESRPGSESKLAQGGRSQL